MGKILRSTPKRSGGAWSLPRGTPRDRGWWRFNVHNYAALVAFLERRYPQGCFHPGRPYESWVIRQDGTVLLWPREQDREWHVSGVGSRRWFLNGRLVRRHGVSEAFMSALAEMDSNDDGWSFIPRPRYLHTKIPTYCRQGHALTAANVYTMVRKRGGATHVERRCRTCNRARVQQHRRRA